MEFNTILILALLAGITIAFLYGLKRLLDAEAYNNLTNKIVMYIAKAETDIKGEKRGNERLNEVVKNITNTATERERKLLKKINTKALVNTIFTKVVAPAIIGKVVR